MKILLTGGSGDLGQAITYPLIDREHQVFNLDPKKSPLPGIDWIEGSITDHGTTSWATKNVDCVVHIAALHGIHEHEGAHSRRDFWKINVDATANLLEASVKNGVKRFVFISSTSVDNASSFYGLTKRLCEDMCHFYAVDTGAIDVIVLRPRAFIPPWSPVYNGDFAKFAPWFWKGAVHVRDVAQATLQAVDLLQHQHVDDCPVLTLDGYDEFSDAEHNFWDSEGPGTTFARHYGRDLAATAGKHGVDISVQPKRLDITPARVRLGYKPTYGAPEFLRELAAFDRGEGIQRPDYTTGR